MSKTQVLHFDQIKGFTRPGGSTTTPLVGGWMGAKGFTTGIATFPPGAVTRWHSHNVEEMFVVVEGEVQFEFEDAVHMLKRLDSVYAQPGVPHRILNVSDQQARSLWLYATTDVTRTFTDTGETIKHLSDEDLGKVR